MLGVMRLRLALVLALTTATACAGKPPVPATAPSPLVGHAAPEFRRATLDGTSFDTKTARGHVVVLKFFAKYCQPCRETLPETERLHRARPDLTIVGIDEDESESDARELVAAYGLTFPVVHDVGNVLSGRYRVSEMPRTFVVDAKGDVRWVAADVGAHEALGGAVDAVK
jgi:cytochrome c biogenesis protein CcmG/thiol:disulfide interchange protein DsbE